ncbi:MAG: DUF1292 domain-containing protein [Clostridia bacterium]|nr:DUF1292 domain-containing protein [Clostridia bacterium]
MDEMNEYNPDIVTVEDENGKEHTFEIADAIETDDARYVALIPVYDDPEEILSGDGELIILEVLEENGNEILAPIEDEDLFDEIASIFEERLEELYEIEPLDLDQ